MKHTDKGLHMQLNSAPAVFEFLYELFNIAAHESFITIDVLVESEIMTSWIIHTLMINTKLISTSHTQECNTLSKLVLQ